VFVSRLELVDFRNYADASFEFHRGTTAVVGLNGQGKTNLAEALAYLTSLESFRGAPVDALIRLGGEAAIVRATVTHPDGRDVRVELELNRRGRNRVQVNGNKLARTRDLLGVVRVTVFSPDDLQLVKGGPSDRRRFMDDTLVSTALKFDALRLDIDRVVKQRNTLLKQANGRLNNDTASTLDVWDSKLAEIGDQFGHARAELVDRLRPMVAEAYEQLAEQASAIELRYEPVWREEGLALALAAARDADLRRGVSTVGPHRDDVDLTIAHMPARTHASQGEQRTLALALRLSAHRLVAQSTDSSPVLVLDDVLSELDPQRCAALLHHLPPGQVVLTTAGVLPEAARPDAVIRIERGEQLGQ
jgi:DNA replication and repair protein RecF